MFLASMMRTTLSISDDLAETIAEMRERENLSFREVIDILLREGVAVRRTPPRGERYEGPVFDSALQPGIDPGRMNQLVDELEVEAFDS